MQLVDSHAHLDHLEDLEGALARAKEAGVSKIVTIGTSVESSRRAIEIAQQYSTNDLQIFATCGLHPKDAASDVHQNPLHYNSVLESIVLSSDRVVAIGECGLDYFLGDREQRIGTSEKEKEFQRELFRAQIELAADLDLPIVIHCRNGWGEIFNLILKIKNQKSNIRGVFHSWTGTWTDAQKALDLGFHISFSGIATFGNAPAVQDTARRMPLDKMLTETDSPFLTPEPYRGKTNEPKNVKIVAQFVANLRNLPFDKIASATVRNARELFGLN